MRMKLPVINSRPHLASDYKVAAYNGSEIDIRYGFPIDIITYVNTAAWLNNQADYETIRQLALNGKIAATTIDIIHDEKRAKALGDHLQSLGLVTDTFP